MWVFQKDAGQDKKQATTSLKTDIPDMFLAVPVAADRQGLILPWALCCMQPTPSYPSPSCIFLTVTF